MLLLVVVVVLVAVVMLTITWVLGRDINTKAEKIARTGRGINASTDAILQLNTTNELGKSIDKISNGDPPGTGEGVNDKVQRIVSLAQSINRSATSINNSARSINDSARSIDASASVILATAVLIDRDAALINQRVQDVQTRVVRVKRDTEEIIRLGRVTQREASCIDRKVGGSGDHC